MIKRIDDALNRITMYRLMLFYLVVLVGVAALLCFVKVLPYDRWVLVGTTAFFVVSCWTTNTLFTRTFGVPPNVESVHISALILVLIFTPPKALSDLIVLGWVAVLSMASKYILAIRGKHLFNPVALAAVLIALTPNKVASWWVGSAPLLPIVLFGGLLVVRKIRRFDLVASFLLAALGTVLVVSVINQHNPLLELERTVLYSPLLFFAFVIVTEPLTTPPTRRLQVVYGTLVGILFAPPFHLGGLFFTPELAILIGNVLSYIVSSKVKLVLTLKQKLLIAPGIYDFIFMPDRKLAFAPGQYMEWTLGHPDPDNRGNRRYFTLASSPTETEIRLGIKFYEHSSSFKRAMLAMQPETEVMAGQLTGDFVLPDNPSQKCVFIAGGIGITPFRSMIRYLLDTDQQCSIVLLYANKTADEIVYKDVFDHAVQQIGLKIVYVLSDAEQVPRGWIGQVGRIDANLIAAEVPDYKSSVFYVSGPSAMVASFEELLVKMGVSKRQIRTDFFPGLA